MQDGLLGVGVTGTALSNQTHADPAFVLAIGGFLLTVELLSLQMYVGAFWLAIMRVT